MYSCWLCVFVDRNEKAARAAFNASIDGGLTFFDTAEVYGSGVSVKFNLNSLMRVNSPKMFLFSACFRSHKF